MKKLLLATTAASLIASPALANSLNVDLRMDYNATTYTDSTAFQDSSTFKFKTGRLDYQGEVSNTLSYRARLAFTKDATVQKTDKTQPAVEFAYLTHKLSDSLSITLGKLSPEVGGFEGATSGADLYLTSEAYTLEAASFPLRTTFISTNKVLYMTGAKLAYNFNDSQRLSFVATDKVNDSVIAGPTDQHNTMMLGAIYRGQFIDKALSVNLSYHTVEGHAADDRHNLISAGFMWKNDLFSFSTEYVSTEFKQKSTGNTDSLASTIAKFAYTGFEQWTPRLDFIYSEEKIETIANEDTKFTGFGLVAEYRPYKDQNFRYHVAYTNTYQDESYFPSARREEIIVGTRIFADLLK